MTGDGRADYLSVDPITGGLTLWQNGCNVIPDTTTNPDDGGDGTSEGDDLTWETSAACDFTIEYASLNDIANDIPNVGSYCGAIYSINLMVNMLGDALDE